MARNVMNFQERMAARATRVNPRPQTALIGTIQSHDLSTNEVTVTIPNQQDPLGELGPTVLGPMPLLSLLAAPSTTGQMVAFATGTQVVILHLSADGDQYICLGALYCDSTLAPPGANMTPNEQIAAIGNIVIYLTNQNGGSVYLGNGTTITGNPNRILREKDLYPLITALNSHKHSGVNAGAGVSGPPATSFQDPTGSTTIFGGD